MPDELKPILARQMEVYAGFLEHTDHHVGRVVDAVEDLGVLEDTLIYYIIGDNGASAEGSVQGSSNELLMLNGASALETTEFMAARIDKFGTPQAYNHYAVGCTRWTRPTRDEAGRLALGRHPQRHTIVHWPRGIEAKREVRSQFHHVIDVAPTILEAAGLPWLSEARKHNVLPLDHRRVERFNPDLAGRPQLVRGKSQLLFGGMGRLTENTLINIKNKSHSVTAEVEAPEGGAEGVIIAQGGAYAGWSLYAKDGRPTYCYNLFGLQRFKIEGDSPIPSGTRQVRMEFGYDAGGLAKGGTVSLFVDGHKVGEGRVEGTVPMAFSADETADVGCDTASPVSDDYAAGGSVFTGTVNWVQIDIDEAAEDLDHLITPEERLAIAMARQ